MAREEVIEMEGVVVEALPNMMFQVRLDNGHTVTAGVSRKMCEHEIRILCGDKVKVEISSYDLTKGKITYRMR